MAPNRPRIGALEENEMDAGLVLVTLAVVLTGWSIGRSICRRLGLT